jgi:regulator of sigma E protease
MNIVIMVAQLLLSLTILVFVHELGHFLAAKFFKTKVERFYLFFDFLFPMPNVLNFALWKKKIGETEYGFGWFPLGGYVSIAGMVDETQDADQLATEPQPWEYRSKRSWQKMIIILGGIIFNLIFAVLIFAAILKVYNKEYLPAEQLQKGGVMVSDAAKALGFRDGDVILKVNGNTPERFDDLVPMSVLFGGEYEVSRMLDGEKTSSKVTIPDNFYKKFEKDLFYPFYHTVTVNNVVSGSAADKAGLKIGDVILSANEINITHFDLFRQILDSNKNKVIGINVLRGKDTVALKATVGENGKLGFNPGTKLAENTYKMKEYGVLQCLKYGASECAKLFTLNVVNVSKIFKGEINAKESVGGPIAIAKGFGVEWNWHRFWLFTAMISVGLAFANLLPIPGLDGGHAVIITIEAIIRRPINPKVLQTLQTIGTYLILALMVFVFYNDLTKK